jgi:hypothetical protein
MLLTTKTVYWPAQAEIDDRDDEGDLRNEVRAQYGEAAVDAGTPDRGMNDDSTDAADAISNVLHWLAYQGDPDPLAALDRARMHFEAEV